MNKLLANTMTIKYLRKLLSCIAKYLSLTLMKHYNNNNKYECKSLFKVRGYKWKDSKLTRFSILLKQRVLPHPLTSFLSYDVCLIFLSLKANDTSDVFFFRLFWQSKWNGTDHYLSEVMARHNACANLLTSKGTKRII